MELITVGELSSDIQALKDHFTPDSRTDWHMHPKSQVLHVVKGRGYVQESGGQLCKIETGDTIITEPGIGMVQSQIV